MKVLSPKPSNELFKIKNVDAFTAKRLIKKHPIWDALIKIKNNILTDGKNEAVTEVFNDIVFDSDGGSFDKPNQTLYIYVGGDCSVTVTKSLRVFSEGYNSEKEWGVKSWTEMK